jgi:hypothetical protein
LSQAPEHVDGEEKERVGSPGFTTHMLALAKPLSMSKGRFYCMREEKVVLDT